MKDDLERDLDLLALAEGGTSLTPERRAELEQAIAESTSMAEQYEATRLVVQHIDRLPASEPSPAFARGLERKLDAIDEARPWWRRWVDGPARPQFAAATLVVVAAGLGAVMWIGSNMAPTSRATATAQLELLDVAEHLELLEDLDVVENLDVLDDLDVIAALDEEESG